MSTRSRWFAATAVLAAGLTLAAVPSSAETTTDPADAAAGWLGRQFVDGNHLEVVFGQDAFPDYGLTIDGVLALTAAGVGGDTADAAMAYLGQSDSVSSYVGDGTVESYAGSLAKLTLAAQVRGEDPTSFGAGDVDVVARLLARQQQSGRFTDASAFGDFSNSFGQSLAVLALDRQGATTPATSAATYLAGQQCPDGGFPEQLEQQSCTSQVDATAFAVQALVAVGDTTNAGEGVGWLETQQGDDGGFGNANSTGLAAAALAVGGSTAAADAVAFLTSLQQGCAAAAADRGAIAFDAGGVDDRAARATAQGVLGLTGADLATLAVAGGESATLPELDCAVATTTTTAPTTPTTTGLPATPPSGSPITSLSSSSVAAGGTLTIDEPGFQPNEDVRIGLYSDPVLLATTKADASGKVSVTLTIPAGTPAGSHTLVLFGTTTVKVSTITVTAVAGGQALARTGQPIGPEALVGVFAVGAGAALVVASRRRRSAAVG